MQVISVDRPNGYITRVNEGKPLQISIDVGGFGEKVPPILVQVYHLKQLIRSVYQNVRLSQTASPDNANWLDRCNLIIYENFSNKVIPSLFYLLLYT